MKRLLARLCIKITGLKPSRIREWRTLILEEGRRLSWPVLLVVMAKGGLGLGGVSKRSWRQRIGRGCGSCAIYDRARHACRDTAGRGLGCGCWMPVKALVRDPRAACWRVGIGDKVAGWEGGVSGVGSGGGIFSAAPKEFSL